MAIERYTDFQLGKALALAYSVRGFEPAVNVVSLFPKGAQLPYMANIERGVERFQFVDKQFCFGWYLCLRTLSEDLVQSGNPGLALDILKNFNKKN